MKISSIMRQIAIAHILVFLLLCVGDEARAQDDSVYLIKAFSCPFFGQSMQTGFIATGLSGIVTALHGVVGCKDIQAEQGQITVKSLSVSEVDVKNDVALLTSPEMGQGASLVSTNVWRGDQQVWVVGHPLGIELLRTPLSLGRPPARPLRGILTPAPLKSLVERRSPDPNISVLSINGVMLPGDSGAPILDAANNVLGIADGGLLGGTSGITWAIPFVNVVLTPAVGNTALSGIVLKNPGELFSINTDLPPRFPIKKTQKDGEDSLGSGHFMITDLTLSRSGDLDAVIDITNTNWFEGFCGKFAFWFFDKDQNVVWRGGLAGTDQWCVYARATLWRGSQLRRTWNSKVPPNLLNEIRSFATLQTTGEKHPFELITASLTRASQVKTKAPVE